MANPEHLETLKQGVEGWNEWRKRNPDLSPDLEGADLHEAELGAARLGRAKLSLAKLQGSQLSHANLVHADLTGVNLWAANLSGANLNDASIGDADLSAADLTAANLSRADLRMTSLIAANLRFAILADANLNSAGLDHAEFTGAFLYGTNFANVDLSAVKGLNSVQHGGPSTIGIDTIYLSHGQVPEVFLRGCGVPDDLIGYIKSIAGAIEYYSCFISHSTKDQEFADRLYADLQNKGVRCWFAPHDIRGGGKLHEQLDEAIRLHDKLLLILSEHSMNSEWVKTEIAKARKRELKERRKMLFPVSLVPYDPVIKDWECFDADTGKDSAREIREYYIPDFSNWKDHDSYQKAFQRLVNDLKQSAADPPSSGP